MYSGNAGFTVGAGGRGGQNIPGAPTGYRTQIDPRIYESWAKNAMIGDLFGGYQGWVAAGKPDLGNDWRRYMGVATTSMGNTHGMDFDRLRRQGDLRGLPSRDDMLAKLGIGGGQPAPTPEPTGQLGPPGVMFSNASGARDDQYPQAAGKPTGADPFTPGPQPGPSTQYDPWNMNWIMSNIYGGGFNPYASQPPGQTIRPMEGSGAQQPMAKSNYEQPFDMGSRGGYAAQPGWGQSPYSSMGSKGNSFQPFGKSGGI